MRGVGIVSILTVAADPAGSGEEARLDGADDARLDGAED